MPQPGRRLVQRELRWVREQRCGAGLGKRGASLEPAACKPFHHAPARTYPRAVPPDPPAEQEVTAGCELGVSLQLHVGRSNSPALGLGKGKRRVSYSPHPASFKSRGFLHEDGDLSPCHAISPGAQRFLDTRSQRPQEQSLLKQDSCNQLVPTLLDPPAPRSPGRRPVEPEEPRAYASPQSVPGTHGSLWV